MSLAAKQIEAIMAPRDFLFPAAGVIAVLQSPTIQNTKNLMQSLFQVLIPTLTSAAELAEFTSKHWNYLIIPYLLQKKTAEELLLSTSSMHMNWLWPNVLYVPVNMSGQEHIQKRKIYECALQHQNIIFYNHTIPHKSHLIMQELFGPGIGDYLIRQGNTFTIADGNGKAFIQMVNALAGGKADFAQATVVIVGVGGSGTLAVNAILSEQPKRLILVDISDKSELAHKVGAEFYPGVEHVPDLNGELLFVIDSTAHFEAGIQRSVALDLVEKYDQPQHVFIDYNMNTPIGAYDHLATQAGVGQEYVGFTNYIMMLEIINAAAAAGISLVEVTREVFDQTVAQSVAIREQIKAAFSAEPKASF